MLDGRPWGLTHAARPIRGNTVCDAGVAVVRNATYHLRVRHRTLFLRDPEGNLIEVYAEY
ncbi:hypothetical protein SAMN05216298_0442 [Glycomyces sambucus]|uniref:Glyoxalase/Bleomycin resistance protein/Dioxygenase superfamily protein n=1 Tax=Glycomyces sambucus TaxID=380244 RepID=A0A1G9CNU3_9ACTN|nr:hypothetical protein SAMN05216298_0442 [Glycomyces sambucus]